MLAAVRRKAQMQELEGLIFCIEWVRRANQGRRKTNCKIKLKLKEIATIIPLGLRFAKSLGVNKEENPYKVVQSK